MKFPSLLALPPLLAAVLALALLASVARASATSTGITVAASDHRFVHEGRFDFSDRAAPVVIWQGSRIRIDFSGDALALLFDGVQGQVFFDATIDGTTSVAGLRENAPAEGTTFTGLGAGRHHLVLFKRSEAAAGTVHFRGVRLAEGATAWAATAPAYAGKMEFIGDSITVGACDEDGEADQWDDRRTHNNAVSYGALTAAAFSADYRNIAVSGMGVSTGWVDFTAGQIWDRVYPDPESRRADLSAWSPDVVFVNLGENDRSFTKAHDQPFPADFATNYVTLVQAIQHAWPRAHIVLLRGGMHGGAKSEALRRAWETAVAELEGDNPRISHFVFTHWSTNHPRVADHRAMADELIGWLRAQPFMFSVP